MRITKLWRRVLMINNERLQWVIDTWVLRISTTPNTQGMCAISFLNEILRYHSIKLDFERKIDNEYKRHIQPGTHAAFWWEQIVRLSGKIHRYSSKLSSRHRRRLLSLAFDLSDLPFVSVASKGKDKLLVSEDSDYNKPVKEYLENHLKVRVLNLEEALEKAKI